MIEADRLVAPTARIEEEVLDRAIRPKSLADYTGRWRFLSKRPKVAVSRSTIC